MDEPTANLDPLVRQEILDILADDLQNEGISVFFSTHITSDLDKIADYVQFLHAGKLILTDDKESLLSRHRIIKGRTELLTPELEQKCIYPDRSEFGFRALTEHYPDCYALLGREAIYEVPTIEDIFIGYTKRGGKSK